jgi:N-acetylmuramoyl-L-alanine amidase CwlA
MRTTALFAAAALSLTGCFQSLPGAEDDEAHVRPLDSSLQALTADELFELAAGDYGVPRDLLAAVAWKQSAFAPGDHDHGEAEPAHGWLGLTPDQVDVAVAVTGYDRHAIEEDREAGIFAGAAVLDALRDELVPLASTLQADATWWEVVVDFAQMDEEWLAHDFAADVFRTLQEGLFAPTLNGDTVVIDARELPGLQSVRFVEPPRDGSGSHSSNVGYPGRARFTPAHSSNQSSRSGGTGAINRVVLHTTEGSYNGAISWFRNSSSNVSAHYVLRKSDGEVTQMVSDDRKAWHACSNNNDTIGIEHEGASSNPATWTAAMFDSSARLTAWLVTQYDIPIDRQHIVGHGEIQPASCSYRYDPGPHFDWDAYLQKVAAYAHGTSSASEPEPIEPTPELPPMEPEEPATVSFVTPRNGDTVGNPVIMKVQSTGTHHTEIWAGPYQVARDMTANPAHAGALFHTTGEHTVTVKAFSAAGAQLASQSITIEVANLQGRLQPTASQQSGMTYQLNATVEAGSAPSYVRYFVDGELMLDSGSNSPIAVGDNYGLDYTFTESGHGRLVQARGYDDDDKLVAEGFVYVDVEHATGDPGSIFDVIPTGVTGRVMRLQAQASANVAYVEYRVDGHLLHDMVTGQPRGLPQDYAIWYEFSHSGARTLEVRAFDASGQLMDVSTQTIYVPSPELELTWSRQSSMVYLFEAQAPAGTAKVVIDVDGYVLHDENTGNEFAPAPEFKLLYHFNYGTYRPIRARAYDAVGNLIDEWNAHMGAY